MPIDETVGPNVVGAKEVVGELLLESRAKSRGTGLRGAKHGRVDAGR